MNKKLSLSLNQQTIELAKNYAKSKKISLSKLIESYLNALITQEKREVRITPLVKSLSGLIDLEHDVNFKEAYTQHLIEKHQ